MVIRRSCVMRGGHESDNRIMLNESCPKDASAIFPQDWQIGKYIKWQLREEPRLKPLSACPL